MYEARSMAVCCWHARAPVRRSRLICNANKYLQFTAPVTNYVKTTFQCLKVNFIQVNENFIQVNVQFTG